MNKKMLRLFSVIFMILVNTTATTLPLNNVSTKVLSDRFSTLITPAGYTFSIWPLIYGGIIILTILVIANKIFFSEKAYKYFIISSLLNGFWIVARHYGNLHLSMLIIVGLLISLVFLDRDNKRHAEPWIRNIFLVYFGRVLIATSVMTMVYLQYQLGIINDGNVLAFGVGAIILAGIINLLILYKEKNIWTSLVAIWALQGIISGQTNIYIINSAYIFIILLGLGIIAKIIFDYRNKIIS